MLWNNSGLMTDLTERDLLPMKMAHSLSFAEAVWRLYDAKRDGDAAGRGLSDLVQDHPSCQKLVRNEGIYAGAFAAADADVAIALGEVCRVGAGEPPHAGSGSAHSGGR